MSNLFQPSSNPRIKNASVSTEYSKHVIDSVDPLQKNSRREYVKSYIPVLRKRIVQAGIVLGLCVIVVRLGYLQMAQGAYYREVSEGNRVRTLYENADRGVIKDITGESLVKNVPEFELVIVPSGVSTDSKKRSGDLTRLSEISSLSIMEIQQLLDQSIQSGLYDQPISLVDQVDYDTALTWASEIDDIAGASIQIASAREYAYPEAYAHVLGYLGKITADDITDVENGTYLYTDYIGKAGVEESYETALRGIKGRKRIEVNAAGKEIDVIAEEVAVSGNDVVLAIDNKLQLALYDALSEVTQQRNSPGGAAVAIDPRTGHIKALVSFPGYDLNAFSRGLSQEEYTALIEDEKKPLFNKAIQGEYPSGSTFKIIMAAAALEEGEITPSTTVQSTGGVRIDKWYFPDWKAGGHGVTDVRKALAESVNTFFYLVGGGSYNESTRIIEGGLGIAKINEYAKRFGLSVPLGIDIAGEADGFLPTPEWKEEVKGESWYIGDTYNTSIGQGDILLTPLQVASYTAAIANGGTLYKPQLLERTESRAGVVSFTNDPIVIRDNIVGGEVIRTVQQGMRDAVLYGSARSMQVLPVSSAGKTGTSQSGRSSQTDSWYTTFLPYESPELVITVLVEEGGEATEAAVPVVRQALLNYYAPAEELENEAEDTANTVDTNL